MISTVDGIIDTVNDDLMGETRSSSGLPLIYTTAGPANGERQILIARLCSLGHSEAAANDALDALPNGNFDQLLMWISRRRLAILKSDAEEEKRLRRLEEVERTNGSGSNNGLRVQSISLNGLGISRRLSDAGSEDSAMLLPDVQLIDRTSFCDPMHRPPDPRTTPRPRSILKTSHSRANREGRIESSRDLLKDTTVASLWQKSRVWFSLSTRLGAPAATSTNPVRKDAPYQQRQNNSLRIKQTPYSVYLPGPPSPSLSVESDELPTRQLKQVRFPIRGMAIKYLYVAERPIQPGLRLDEHGRTADGQLLNGKIVIHHVYS
jgi:hypothetical protein